MSIMRVKKSSLESLAATIKEVSNSTEKLKFPSEWEEQIRSIPKEEDQLYETITKDGTYTYLPEEGTVWNGATITVRRDMLGGGTSDPVGIVVHKTIKENGEYEIVPDVEDALIAKVDLTVNVPTGGGGGEDFIGIKYSNYENGDYYLPKTADARSLDKVLSEDNIMSSNKNERRYALYSAFYNATTNANGGYFVNLEEVYLPTQITGFLSTFYNCVKLKHLYGDFANNIAQIQGGFYNCRVIEKIPYFPNLKNIANNSFLNCYALTEISLSSTVTSIATNAFSGCTNLTDIYVGFAEGAVENAPWGATKATIHYNTVFDENGEPTTT